MANGVFAFAVAASIILCCGCILAVMIMRGAWARQQREALTSQDLTALEESAVLLVEQMKAEADRGITEIERRCASLREFIKEADDRISMLADLSNRVRQVRPRPKEISSGRQVIELAENGMDCADIAKSLGLTLGEVDLMFKVQGSKLKVGY